MWIQWIKSQEYADKINKRGVYVGKNKRSLIFTLLFLVFSIIGFSKVYDRKKQTDIMKEKVEELKATKEEATIENNDLREDKIYNSKPMLEEYKSIYQENKDFIGWLSIPGTAIDYPVMQKPGDNEYYLNHDFDHNENINGALMLDKANDIEEDTNLIIHGHNMKSGEMFGSLDLFRDEEYLKERPIINFDNLYEKRSYKIIAVIDSQVYKKSDNVFKYYHYTGANSQEEFNEFKNFIKDNNLIENKIDMKYGDEYITLSTCSYHVENGRLVIVGGLTPNNSDNLEKHP